MTARQIPAAGMASEACGEHANPFPLSLPKIVVSDGSLEALKWLGLALMTVDHVNKYLFHGRVSTMFAIGRLALPIFLFVLAYNLARPATLSRGGVVFPRLLLRLGSTAAVANVPFVALGGLAGGWWPLNIFATLFVAVATIYLQTLGGFWCCLGSCIVIIVAGGLVEYWWPAICLCLAAWCYCRHPSWKSLTAILAATLALDLNGWVFAAEPLVNTNLWAFAAIPIIVATSQVSISMPRFKWAFYVYYPAHLCVLWLLVQARSATA